MSLRVLRIYHAGRDPAHRARERALVRAGVDVHLVVPRRWQADGDDAARVEESCPVTEVDVRRPGDNNRWRLTDPSVISRLVAELRPDVVDLHEEPFSSVVHQLLPVLPSALPVVLYTAQNIDKRFPPPFAQWERTALARAAGCYPCSRQAAAVARGKGFAGLIRVLPLGIDETLFRPGEQRADDDVLTLALVGRLVAEKGPEDAVHVLSEVARVRRARLLLVGNGPALQPSLDLATELGVRDCVEHLPWLAADALADVYRQTHVVLTPSRSTPRWVEQFGRMIVEAQASGAIVAGYATGSIPEVAGDAALLRPEGDSQSLARAVQQCVTDGDEFARRRTAGLDRAQEFTWERIAAQQIRLYRDVVAGSTPLELPRSPAARRANAIEEFGASATAAEQSRPFALPILRERRALGSPLGRVLDVVGETRARLARR